MQSEEFDKKIIEAAEHHHPAYEEKAWEKMEILLDKHLPVKKDRRRRILFFLLLFLFLGSGAYLYVHTYSRPATLALKPADQQNTNHPRVDKPSPAATTKQTTENTAPVIRNPNEPAIPATGRTTANPALPETNAKSSIKNESQLSAGDKNSIISAKQPRDPKQEPTLTGKKSQQAAPNKARPALTQPNSPATNLAANITSANKRKKNNYNRPPATSGQTALHSPNKVTGSQDQYGKPSVQSEAPGELTPKPTPPTPSTNSPLPASVDQSRPNSKTPATVKDSLGLQKIPAAANEVSTKPKIKKAHQKIPLAITVSAGPDLSFMSLNNLGTTKLRFGAGLSYALNRFTIRSGFYATRKVYTAAGSAYHPYYPNLEKVDGNCNIYEIPLLFSYRFGAKKNHSWFASTGLSSYLMKKETYGYLSKNPTTGATDYYSYTWNNKNKHYFSVLDLSMGYEKKFSNTISLIAEPYLQIPLTGIGSGKMNLNSAGIAITLSVKPFNRKK